MYLEWNWVNRFKVRPVEGLILEAKIEQYFLGELFSGEEFLPGTAFSG